MHDRDTLAFASIAMKKCSSLCWHISEKSFIKLAQG
jgi:hypothetical protein